MKNLIKHAVGLAVILLLASTANLAAQQKITEGCLTISYSVDSLKPRHELPSQEKLSIFFKDGYLKTVKTVSAPKFSIETSHIRQLGQPKMLILTETAGLKLAITATEQEAEQLSVLSQGLKMAETSKTELLNAMLDGFMPTGQHEQIDGHNAAKYSAQTGSEPPLYIWTTEEVELPFDLIRYEPGTLGKLLKNKKIKGTLCRLSYGNKLEVAIRLDTQPVQPISMAVPEGYQTFAFTDIMGHKTQAKN